MGVVTRDALSSLLEEGLDVRQIAQALRVTRRSVDRALVRYKFRELKPINYLTEDEIARAKALFDEGMPLTWIAEDLHRSDKTLSKQLGMRPALVSQWKEVWQQIRRSEQLLELHRQIAPQKEIA